MSELYKVHHIHLDEVRIVKLMRADLLADESQQLRFRHEAKLATRVHHPNVATLHDFSRLPDGGYYMVWEFLDGETIQSWSTRNGFVPPVAAIDICIQVLDGLEAIHSAGIVHRDISPDNIILTRAQSPRDLRGVHVKIIDLGIAKSLELAHEMRTETGIFIGKARYASPEQAGMLAPGENVDARSDLYSLGVTLFEMLTGQLPFQATSTEGYLTKHLHDEPMTFREAAPEISIVDKLEGVVQKSLKKNRDERFSSAAEFRAALVESRESILEPPGQEVRTNPRRRVGDLAALSAPYRTDPRGEKPGQTPETADLHSRTESGETLTPRDAMATSASASAADQPLPPLPEPPAASPEVTRKRPAVVFTVLLLVFAVGAFAFWWMRQDREERPIAQEKSSTATRKSASPVKPAAGPEESDVTVSAAPIPPNVILEGDPALVATAIDTQEISLPESVDGVVPVRDDRTKATPEARTAAKTPSESSVPAAIPEIARSTSGSVKASTTPGEGEISESDASRSLVSWLSSRDYCDEAPTCLGLQSLGYKNVGYTFDVYSRGCGDDRHLGRWRVDSKTREFFVQRKSGRYGRP